MDVQATGWNMCAKLGGVAAAAGVQAEQLAGREAAESLATKFAALHARMRTHFCADSDSAHHAMAAAQAAADAGAAAAAATAAVAAPPRALLLDPTADEGDALAAEDEEVLSSLNEAQLQAELDE